MLMEEPDVAEAIINDEGLLIGARILDRITTYEKYPEILVIGGNGYGAKLLPSLACLDTTELTQLVLLRLELVATLIAHNAIPTTR